MNGSPELAGKRLDDLFRRDRAIVLACLIALVLLSWFYLGRLATDMARGDTNLMGMASSAMVAGPQPWTPVTFVLMLAMWWVMMVGMMIPSAAPAVLIFSRAQRRQLPEQDPVLRTLMFTLGYLLIWLAFSAAATTLQWALATTDLLSPVAMRATPMLGGMLFAAAGLYQLTPLKRTCLRHCRSPLHFLSERWRQGDIGALRMGMSHGAYCVGCCWLVMVLLFAGGVMNLLWVAGIAVLVLLEKVLPLGEWVARASGVAMILVAAWFLLPLW